MQPAHIPGAEPGISPPDTLLGVERSINGFRWVARHQNARLALQLSQQYQLPELMGHVLAGRGVTLEEAAYYLAPSLKEQLPDPSCLKDMDKAAERLADAVLQKQRVAILGDYDVDGGTSTALLLLFLRHLEADVIYHIPDRMLEGYGPSVPAMQRFAEQGAKVMVTVDCGTVSFEPLAEAARLGMDSLVIDHHIGTPELPMAHAIVNPNRFDEESTLGHLAAVGVTFLLVIATNRCLREKGFYATCPEPNPLQWLDLVALGTVCDVVSLTGLNRAFVSQGLKILANRRNIGLTALCDISGLDSQPTAYHLGFLLGPRINAGGRVGASDTGVKLLSSQNPDEARQLAEQLNQWNAERKAIEAQVLEEASAQVEAMGDLPPVLTLAGEGWHAGVIGIVAGRLKETYQRPVSVIAMEQGIGKASCRSVPGVDMGAAVLAAKAQGLLIAGGGHAMAAGFTVEEAQLPALREFLLQRMCHAAEVYGRAPTLKLDGVLAPSGATVELVRLLEKAAPYGQGNPTPRFVLAHAHILSADVVGDGHVRLWLVDETTNRRRKAMAFRAMQKPLGEVLLSARGRRLHLAGTLQINHWQDRESVDFFVDDAAFSR